MKSSNLELRALATLEDENKVLGPVTIRRVISTSMRVEIMRLFARIMVTKKKLYFQKRKHYLFLSK